jgi:hypothetical protein
MPICSALCIGDSCDLRVWNSIVKPLLLTLMLLLLGPRSAAGQGSAATPSVPRRVATLTAGIGNVMGWFGLHGERYFARERLSGFAGLGYTPSIDEGDPSGLTFAVGLRGFTNGIKHRGFLALSISQLAVESGFIESPRRFYGPGLEAGYQYASRGGFTFMASLGLGYAPGVPEGNKEVGEVLALGLGYTWRR